LPRATDVAVGLRACLAPRAAADGSTTPAWWSASGSARR